MQIDREKKIPLYMQVYESLVQMIEAKEWQTGELLPSERELSALFEVDRLTVRRALGMIAQEGLVEKIAGLGTRVTDAASLVKEYQNFRNVIFLLPKVTKNGNFVDRITDPIKTDLFFRLENECKKRDYNLTYTTIGPEEALSEVLEGRGVSGVFFASKIDDKFFEEARRLKIATVVLDNECDYFPSLRPAREKGTYEAIQYLIGLNHRQIGFISGLNGYITSRDCFEGYKRALGDANIDWKDQIIKEGDWTFDGGYKAMREIIAEPAQLPSAVFACNDLTALGAMEAIKAAGLAVPRDISVIGVDDIEQSKYGCPKLSTVRVNVAAMASIACQNLLSAIESRELQNVQMFLPTELVVRESTAPKSSR